MRKNPSSHKEVYQGGWYVIPLAATGASHKRQRIERQDSHGYVVHEGNLILAIADGHGSQPLSRIGADLAVDTFLEVAEEFLDMNKKLEIPDKEKSLQSETRSFRDLAMFSKSLINIWKDKVRKRYDQICNAIGHPPEESDEILSFFGTTLIGAIVVADRYCVFFRLGDGGVFITPIEEDQPKAVFLPGQDLDTHQTYSLTSTNAHELAQVQINFSIPASIILSTDGITGAFDSEGHLMKALGFFNTETTPGHTLDLPFLQHSLENGIGINSGDDLTLIIAHNQGSRHDTLA